MEGQEIVDSSELESKGETSHDEDGKKKKSTKEKTKEALEKKAEESLTKDGQVDKLADISDVSDDNSRREMLENDAVNHKVVKGNSRFDADDGGEADLPKGNEEGGGFF